MGRDKETFKKEYKAEKQLIGVFKKTAAESIRNAEVIDENAQAPSEPEIRKNKFVIAKAFYNNNKEAIKASFANLMKASVLPDDKDESLEFIRENGIAIAMLESEEMAQYFNDENDPDAAEFQQMIKDSAEIRKHINNWFEYYDKYADTVLDEEEKVNEAKEKPVQKLSISGIIEKAKRDIKEESLDDFKEYLNLIKTSGEEVNQVYFLTGMYMMANKYPKDKELLISCKDTVSWFAKKDEDGSFKRFVSKGEGKVMLDDLGKKWKAAELEQGNKVKGGKVSSEKAPVNTEQKNNVKVEKVPAASEAPAPKAEDLEFIHSVKRQMRINTEVFDLEGYAKALKAASKHDKQDYKELIAMVNDFNSRDKLLYMKDGKPVAGTENLTDNQREALSFFKIKDKINAYITHKAKDGVNRNAYTKLAVVESLNQYVSKKIKDLHPGEFSFEGATYKESDVHVTYADELKAEIAKIKDPSVLNNIMSARGINNPNAVEINAENVLIDTSTFDSNNAKATGLSGKNLTVYKNVAGCMNRIMLKAQVDNIPETLKSIAEGKDPDRIPKHLNEATDSFILKPVKFNASEKKAVDEIASERNIVHEPDINLI